MNEIERAEFVQNLKAYLIPASLFLSCLIMAAGTFLIYNRLPAGWLLIALSGIMIILAFSAFASFHNKLRAHGRIASASGKVSPEHDDGDTKRELSLTAGRSGQD